MDFSEYKDTKCVMAFHPADDSPPAIFAHHLLNATFFVEIYELQAASSGCCNEKEHLLKKVNHLGTESWLRWAPIHLMLCISAQSQFRPSPVTSSGTLSLSLSLSLSLFSLSLMHRG